MKSSLRTYILLIIFMLAQSISACTKPTAAVPGTSYSNVTIPNTEVRQLNSAATGRDYDIYIRLPDGYTQN